MGEGENLPVRPYREVAFFTGDIRVLLEKVGRPFPRVQRNDLGEYYVADLIIMDVPIKLVGLVPFAEHEFTVVADGGQADLAKSLVKSLLDEVGYRVAEVLPKSYE